MSRGAVFFDVDGTLVPGTSSGQHLAGLLGHVAALREAEAAYDAGTMTNQEASVIDARGWTGRTPAEVTAYLAGLPLVTGIDATVAWCRAHNLVPFLATLAWDVVGADLCRRFGFARACGPSLEVVRGSYTGRVLTHFDEWGKRDFARSAAAALGLDLSHCAAVGDSRSDLPLFADTGFSVAFNATPAARAAASARADGPDLRAVLPHLEHWLTTSS
ncbi:HAD family hydrolase [Actinoplanes sp. GCM10030250]|uniref:HAD family hydrolase n=1 Tax=Actinoplanes sp. GCM10030250 TaxID=3273376 RepID=UPI00362224EB